MQEMRAEKEAVAAEKAAAAGLVLAPRPAQWTPPQDASALVEYVTLDMSATDGMWQTCSALFSRR